MKNKLILVVLPILLIVIVVLINLYFFIILNSNVEYDSLSDRIKYQICLYTTKNPDKIRDDYFMVHYNTTLSESEIENHIFKMGFNYSSIQITNDFYLIAMHNQKIKKEAGENINKATNNEIDKFSQYILNYSSLVTIAERNKKGILAMYVEFQRGIPPEISKKILDKIILDYDSEVWTNDPLYYFNERGSWAHIRIPEGSGITEVGGYCRLLMEKEVIGAQLVGDRISAL